MRRSPLATKRSKKRLLMSLLKRWLTHQATLNQLLPICRKRPIWMQVAPRSLLPMQRNLLRLAI